MDIKGVIKSKGYTIQEVADMIKVNRVTLTLTLQGNPTYKKMKKIADAIGCDVMDFFKDEAKNQPANIEGANFIRCPKCDHEFKVKLEVEE